MHTIKLKNFNILVNDDQNNVIAVQSGKLSAFDADLARWFEWRLDDFLSMFDQHINLTANAKILDIGSGNSIFDMALAKAYPDLDLKFTLVDGNNFDLDNIVKDLHSPDYKVYNVWGPVIDNIKQNGLNLNNFKTVDPTDEFWAESGSVDVVMSTSSWGWHYPVDTYLSRVYNLLKPGGYLIIRPLLNINNYLETINALFDKPLYLKSFLHDYQPIPDTNNTQIRKWSNYVKLTNPSDTMFYNAVWQKAHN